MVILKPISFLAVLSEVLNNIISNHQHGFRSKHSCKISLTMIYEYLPNIIDNAL